MLRKLKDIIFWLCCCGISFAQNQSAIGDATTLAVYPVSGASYLWELYDSYPSDFQLVTSNCPPEKAYFTTSNTENEVEVVWKKTGIYYYKITISDGCTNNVKIGKIEVTDAKNPNPPNPTDPCKELFLNMKIPNTITVNGDSVNDVWEITELKDFCIKCNNKNTLTIFNRWGVKVYEKENYMLDHFRFRGYSEHTRTVQKNKKLPEGTYFYVITLENGTRKTGWLLIKGN